MAKKKLDIKALIAAIQAPQPRAPFIGDLGPSKPFYTSDPSFSKPLTSFKNYQPSPYQSPAPMISPQANSFQKYMKNAGTGFVQNNLQQQLAAKAAEPAEQDKGIIDKVTGGQGLVGGFFDLLSRGAYAAGNVISSGVSSVQKMLTGDVSGGVKQALGSTMGGLASPAAQMGWSGQSKITPSRAILEGQGVGGGYAEKAQDISSRMSGPGRFAAGLVLDVAADPTTYIGSGAIKGGFKAVKDIFGKGGETVLAKAANDIAVTAANPATSDAAKALGKRSFADDAIKAYSQAAPKPADIKAALLPDKAVAGSTQGLKNLDLKNAINVNPVKLSEASTSKFRGVLDGIIKSTDTPPQQAIQSHKGALAALSMGGKVMPSRSSISRTPGLGALPKSGSEVDGAVRKALDAQAKAVSKTVDENFEVPFASKSTPQGVIPKIMTKIASWYGNKDFRPEALDAIGSAERAANLRVLPVQNAIKGMDAESLDQAVKVTRGEIPRDMVDGRVLAASDAIRSNFESLFSSSGVAGHAAGNSVATRMGATMDEINEGLKFYGAKTRLANKHMKDELGNVRDYASGLNFMNAWESTMKVKGIDLMRELRAVNLAVERVARKNALLDDVAERWGVKLKDGKASQPGLVKLKNARFKGLAFSKDHASQIQRGLEIMDEIYRPNSPFMKLFRDITNAWKQTVTIVNPNHHINNMVGDMVLSYLAGVNNPARYKQAISVMKRMSTVFDANDLKATEALMGEGSLTNAIKSAKGRQVVKTKSGIPVTDEQLWIAFNQLGLVRDFHVIEDITGRMAGKMSNLPVFKQAGKLAEKETQMARLAHFIDVVAKGTGKDLNAVFKEAAHTVRKHHPDGGDLTKFEQGARTLIPFYSWLRKSTPLIFEAAILQPGRVSALNKTYYNMQVARGEDASLSNPFNTEGGMFPSWLTKPGTQNPVFAVRNPVHDAISSFADPAMLAKGAINPAIKIGHDVITRERLDTGQPIREGKMGDYLIGQTPILSRGRAFAKEDTGSTSFANWATGANIIRPEDPKDKALSEAFKAKESKAERTKKIKQWAYDNGLITAEQYAKGGKLKKSLIAQFEAQEGK